MSSNAIKVVVRVRPLNANEVLSNASECIECGAEEVNVSVGSKVYTFDKVYKPATTTQHIYSDVCSELVDRFMNGYNVTLFTYGQTGSGKTFTLGTSLDNNNGLIQLALDNIFTRIPNEAKLSLSFIEIYNEQLIDLINSTPNTNLCIREVNGHVYVNSSKVSVDSVEDASALLHTCLLSRKTASTLVNSVSSRSHAILTLSLSTPSTHSIFNFVDLAGSERLKTTQSTGHRVREGISINSGLLSLGNVIHALSNSSKFVPYRDSKLTRILQESLSGNSITVMLCCVSTNASFVLETINTLNYANRTKNIKTNVSINKITDTKLLVIDLQQQIKRLKQELLHSSLPSDGNYEHMKQSYEDKLRLLQHNLSVVEKERNLALQKLQQSKNTSLLEKECKRLRKQYKQANDSLVTFRQKHNVLLQKLNNSTKPHSMAKNVFELVKKASPLKLQSNRKTNLSVVFTLLLQQPSQAKIHQHLSLLDAHQLRLLISMFIDRFSSDSSDAVSLPMPSTPTPKSSRPTSALNECFTRKPHTPSIIHTPVLSVPDSSNRGILKSRSTTLTSLEQHRNHLRNKIKSLFTHDQQNQNVSVDGSRGVKRVRFESPFKSNSVVVKENEEDDDAQPMELSEPVDKENQRVVDMNISNDFAGGEGGIKQQELAVQSNVFARLAGNHTRSSQAKVRKNNSF